MASRLYHYKIGSRSPFCPLREGLLLQWDEGWGEIAPLPGFSKETLDEAKAEILAWLPDLRKGDPKLPSVRFGLASASKPFLRERIRVPLCALETPRRGCSSLKLKLRGLEIQEAIEKVKQYKDAYRLRLDCNRSWTLDEALQFASAFSKDDFDYIEEPVQTLEELIRFSTLTGFPIAVDESLRDGGWRKVPTVVAAVVKPTLMGELPLLKTGMNLVLSSSYESSLGVLQIAKLARQGCLPLGLDTFSDDLLSPPLYVEDGFLCADCPIVDVSKLCLIASAP